MREIRTSGAMRGGARVGCLRPAPAYSTAKWSAHAPSAGATCRAASAALGSWARMDSDHHDSGPLSTRRPINVATHWPALGGAPRLPASSLEDAYALACSRIAHIPAQEV